MHMSKKFGYNADTGDFEIDPAHLAAGLAAARARKRSALRIRALDYRADGLGFDAGELAAQAWIRSLSLHHDLQPKNIEALAALSGLRKLVLREWRRLDFSAFTKLEELTLERGTALDGVDKLEALELLFLNDWRAGELPPATADIAASKVIIGASSKLLDIGPVLKIRRLAQLDLTKLTKLEVAGPVSLDALVFLHVEDVPGWTDFGNLASDSLLELELFTKAKSLKFLSRLPALRKLVFWNIEDGDLAPVLDHPSLREVYFAPHKRHYSHKEAELNALLKERRGQAGRKSSK